MGAVQTCPSSSGVASTKFFGGPNCLILGE